MWPRAGVHISCVALLPCPLLPCESPPPHTPIHDGHGSANGSMLQVWQINTYSVLHRDPSSPIRDMHR